MTLDTTDPATRLMGETNRRVRANLRPGSREQAGWLAAIRLGITPTGEAPAMSRAAPYVADLDSRARSAALRGAAIRAINMEVAQVVRTEGRGRPALGHTLSRLADKDGGHRVEEQLSALPLMTVDAAALVLDDLIGRCARHRLSVDFYDLARTLIFWDHGVGGRATERRNRIVMDFYRGAPTASIN